VALTGTASAVAATVSVNPARKAAARIVSFASTEGVIARQWLSKDMDSLASGGI
jgi:hypothetical protein